MNDTASTAAKAIRLQSLDFVRGVAAMAVIFWHWQHFFLTGPGELADRSVQPFYVILQPLYDYGWIAVDIFFCLSGFVFFWLYERSIAEGRMNARRFSALRFSRLYPLHFATLIYMLVAQMAMVRATGSYFVYTVNDASHFVRHLFFVQAWGIDMPESFNGPSWSVSVELMLYALFFILARLKLANRMPLLLGVAAAGALCLFLLDRQIGRGILEFFLGGIVYRIWARSAHHVSVVAAGRLLWGMIGLMVVELVILRFDLAHALVGAIADELPFVAQLDKLVDPGFLFFLRVVQIPLTVYAFATHELQSGTRFYEKPARLGDLTYASYLIHLPLQISLALGAAWGFYPSAWLQSGWLLPLFFGALIGLSILIYLGFEMPAQRWLRRWLSA